MFNELWTTSVALLALLVVTLLPGSAAAQGSIFDGDPATVTRIDGATPRDFAIQIASRLGERSRGRAVIVSDQEFADALSASALAQFGLLFFASPDAALDDAALDQLRRVLFDNSPVYIVGGTAAVTDQVEAQITGLGFEPTRLAGPTRVETALAVADEVLDSHFGAQLPDAYLARAFGPADNPTAAWADSVAAGPAAAANQVPILLTGGDGLHPAVRQWLAANSPARVTALGGTAAVPQAVLSAVPVPSRRVAGATRDETAEAIFRRLPSFGVGEPVRPVAAVNLFDELGWAYGLAVGAPTGDAGGGLVAVNPDADLVASQRVVACGVPADLVVAGPTSQVSDARVEGLRACPPGEGGSSPGEQVALRGDGIGAGVDFGLTDQEVVDRADELFGPPEHDSGRIQPLCELAGPDGQAGRTVSYANGLTVTFKEAGTTLYFTNWAFRTDAEPALSTPEGVTLGTSNAEVRSTYGVDALLRPGDEGGFPPPIWEVSTGLGPIAMTATGNGEDASIDLLAGGGLQFCE